MCIMSRLVHQAWIYYNIGLYPGWFNIQEALCINYYGDVIHVILDLINLQASFAHYPSRSPPPPPLCHFNKAEYSLSCNMCDRFCNFVYNLVMLLQD